MLGFKVLSFNSLSRRDKGTPKADLLQGITKKAVYNCIQKIKKHQKLFGSFDNSMYLCTQQINQDNIMYTKVNYKSKEEAVAAFRRMVQRKREWVAQAEKELDELSQKRKLAF